MRFAVATATLVVLATSCASMSSEPTPAPPSPRTSAVAFSGVPATPPAKRLIRPGPATYRGATPVLLRAVAEAGTFVSPYGPWRYDGVRGTLEQPAALDEPLEHPAPTGTRLAVERQTRTPGGFAISNELAIRDAPGGTERVVYRAPELFYWSGWSPDGRYVALWEVDSYSGSVDLDGRPLVVIDTATGRRFDLGRTLLNGSTAWTSAHMLAFVAGLGRDVWKDKSLRLWSPESGIRDVSPPGISSFAPAWSADGASLYFASGPAGDYEPLSVFAGQGVGDRHITVYDVATGKLGSLAREPGYVEEGARPSRDGRKLLLLRRKTVVATDMRSIPDAPLEVWLTDPSGGHGVALVRITKTFGYYGWDPGPSEWQWSE